MSNIQKRRKKPTTITLEMIARLIGTMAFLTGLVYLWGLLDPLQQQEDVAGQVVLIVLGSLSLLIAWRWELIGGLAAVVSGILLAALIALSAHNTYSPLIQAFVYGSPFFIAGLVFLVDAYQHNRTEQYQAQTQ